jgi:hypothetical protein
MEQITVRAENKEGVLLGTQLINRATTMDELREEFEDKDILALVYRSHIIDVQRELRSKALAGSPSAAAKLAELKAKKAEDDAKVAGLIAKAEAMKASGDDNLYNALVATGVITVSA